MQQVKGGCKVMFYFPRHNGQQHLEALSHEPPMTIFSSEVLAFVQQLSLACIKQKQYAEIVALGYWMRKANLYELMEKWKQEHQGKVVKARGTVFHIAPSNVDTIFVYSWILSLLAGNRNVIRLSTKVNVQQNILLQLIIALLEKDEFIALAKRNILLTYDHNDETTETISMQCHVRVVWGGDETIKRVRKVGLAPMATELAFANRYSLALVHARAFLDSSKERQIALVQQFYNDAYWFDQLACSSPKLIVWEGTEHECADAQHQFWSLLKTVHEDKGSELVSALQVQKLATGMLLAAHEQAGRFEHHTAFSKVQYNVIDKQVREHFCGGGFFVEHRIANTEQLLMLLTDKDQTLSYFGYSEQQLSDLAEQITNRGIDRIVPIGQALNFQEVWDGQSFLNSFTRQITIIG